jgi:ribonuclease HII
MAWIIGIDEAGYGPNLGPFVMTAVACQVPDARPDTNLWQALAPAVRREGDKDDGRLLVADSKVVYSTARGLLGLERGVLGALWRAGVAPALGGLVDWACPGDHAELRCEAWYKGDSPLPVCAAAEDLADHAARFDAACAAAGAVRWVARSAVVCTSRFNAILERAGSKGAVLASALGSLLCCGLESAAGDDAVHFFVDKHGGRNTYAAQIQQALGRGAVVAREEGMARSIYDALGLGRHVRLTFQPRAEAEHFCVALASMASKYLRELLMLEFNRFWQTHVPGLKPTAGYPGDSARFLAEVRDAAARLGLAEAALWRRK